MTEDYKRQCKKFPESADVSKGAMEEKYSDRQTFRWKGIAAVMLFRTGSGAAGQQPDGLIGSGFLHRFLVAIDASSGRLYLTPNRTYRDAEPTWPWTVDLPLMQ